MYLKLGVFMEKFIKTDVLIPLYGSVEIYENDSGELVGEFDYPPNEYRDWEKYYWETTGDDCTRLDHIFPQLKKLIEEKSGKYDGIKLIWDTDHDGYCSLYRIVGVRAETDEEINARLAEKERVVQEQKRKKEDKMKKIKQNKIKLYEKLKQELEK
jgi:hypothetical protein